MTTRTPNPTAPRPAGRTAPEERFADHVRTGMRGLSWHYRLGHLTLQCCPRRTRNRTARLLALARANPACSLSLLYLVTKFAAQYRPSEVLELERAGLTWNVCAVLLSVPRGERDAAIDEALRLRLTSRQVRRLKADRYGPAPARGGRATRPLAGHSPAVQARELANDCHRLCARHRITPAVFERLLQSGSGGAGPGSCELARIRAAAGTIAAMLDQFGALHALLQRVVERCDPGSGRAPNRRAPRTRRPPMTNLSV